MNIEQFQDLATRSSADLEKLFRGEKQLAEQVIKSGLGQMVDAGKAYVLGDEEERLLRSFRRFKATCKAGAIFKWQARPEEGIIAPPEPALIRDPQEVG